MWEQFLGGIGGVAGLAVFVTAAVKYFLDKRQATRHTPPPSSGGAHDCPPDVRAQLTSMAIKQEMDHAIIEALAQSQETNNRLLRAMCREGRWMRLAMIEVLTADGKTLPQHLSVSWDEEMG